MCLGRIIEATGGEKMSPVRRKWLTKFFVGGDVLGLLVQGAGMFLFLLHSCRLVEEEQLEFVRN